MNEEDSIFDPNRWPDVWADLARFMKELEQEEQQAPKEPAE